LWGTKQPLLYYTEKWNDWHRHQHSRQKLTVKGKIHTQEVLVDLNGAVAPDYVFERYYKGYSALKGDYRMLDLKSLEAFLKQNHHLPEIPSAQKLKERWS